MRFEYAMPLRAVLTLLIVLPIAAALAQEKRPTVQDWVSALKPHAATRSLGAKPPQKSTSLIQFEFNSDRLTPFGKSVADDVAQALNSDELREFRYRVEGHTDAKGGDAYNQSLSERRAAAVRDYLVKARGVDATRVSASGKGKKELLRPDAPFAEENRRVAFVLLLDAANPR